MSEPAPRGGVARWALRWAPLAACAGVLVWHALQYDFVTDDAYISFVFSRNFAEHHELSFNLGDPVEGYTNFLWTLLLGVLMMFGVPPELSSRVLGIGFAIGGMIMAFRLTERLVGRGSPWAYLPPLLLALSSGYACWSSGGLETQLYTFLIAGALDAYIEAHEPGREHRLRRVGGFLAAAAMTRPEGLLIAGLLGVHRVARNLLAERRILPRASELACVGVFLAIWAPWFAWRWSYYGYPFPNTYYVKASGPMQPVELAKLKAMGLRYIGRWFTQTGLVFVSPIALVGALVARPRSPRFVFGSLAVLITAVYLGYAYSVGGDFMGLHRFIMPLFVIAAIAVAVGLERLAGLMPAGVARVAVGGVLAVALIGGFAVTQYRLTVKSLTWGNFASDGGIDTPAFLIAYTEDRAAIGKAMASCFRPDDFSIVGGAGAQPYFGRMRAIDVYGLVSSRIAHEEPRVNGRAGHTKWGSERLLAEHDPTFVFYCYDIHGDPRRYGFPGGCDAPWRRRGFVPATMHVPGMREQGEYYTFLVRKDRDFQCPGLVK